MGRLKLGISLRPFRSNGDSRPAGFYSGVLAGLVVDYLAGVEDARAVRNNKLDNTMMESGRLVERDTVEVMKHLTHPFPRKGGGVVAYSLCCGDFAITLSLRQLLIVAIHFVMNLTSSLYFSCRKYASIELLIASAAVKLRQRHELR